MRNKLGARWLRESIRNAFGLRSRVRLWIDPTERLNGDRVDWLMRRVGEPESQRARLKKTGSERGLGWEELSV